jgi:hypothetical protein
VDTSRIERATRRLLLASRELGDAEHELTEAMEMSVELYREVVAFGEQLNTPRTLRVV